MKIWIQRLDWKGNRQYIDLPNQCKHKQLLRIEGKFCGKIGQEQCPHSIRILEPYGQQSKNRCTTHSRKETAPIIAHRKVRCGYLNTKQNACRMDRSVSQHLKILLNEL